MIDYVKILLLGIDIERLSEVFEFKLEVIEGTGEYSSKKVTEYHFCKITIHESGAVLFTGSIHKLWNSLNDVKAPNYKPLTKEQIKKGIKDHYRGFNGNQFTLDSIIEVRGHLEYLFDCKPQQMVFQNIEFGLNISVDFNPKNYLKGLLYHNNKEFEYRYNGNSAQVIHKRYYLKIYNKSYQYGMSQNTIRVEVKLIKSIEIIKTEIKTFNDVSEHSLNKAIELLLKRFNEVVHYDYTIQKNELTSRLKLSLKNYSNPRYWLYDIKPNKRHQPKKLLKEITLKYSGNLHRKIEQKINVSRVIINRSFKNASRVIINSSSIGLNITQKHP
jgi:hypothetical protein